MLQAGRTTGVVLGLMLLAGGMAGCGRDIPIDFHRAVSPCLDLPTTMGFDGTSELVKILTTDFNQKDANGDGVLTLPEAQAKTQKPNLIDDSLFAAVDPKDGKMTPGDLKKAGGTLNKWAGYYKVKLLNRFDRNMDHYLTVDEVKGYLNIDKAAFDAADEAKDGTPGNGDQKLDPDEFLALVLHQNALSCGSTESTDATAASVRRVAYPPAPIYRR